MRAENYRPWGFKLNLMYSSIPPRYFRNLHNFQEFDAPRIDIGLLSASLYEQPIYGPNAGVLPLCAHDFYVARRTELQPLIAGCLVRAGVVSQATDVVLAEGAAFVLPSAPLPIDSADSHKLYVFFAVYWQEDSPGTETDQGIPFLRLLAGRFIPSDVAGSGRWRYHEIRLSRGLSGHQYRPFILPPLFIAYFPDYTDLQFDQDSRAHDPTYSRYVEHVQVSEAVKEPFKVLVARESISIPDASGRFIVSWDGVPVNRSIVASQAYYDWDDDLQSAHGDALIEADLDSVRERVASLEKGSSRPPQAGAQRRRNS